MSAATEPEPLFVTKLTATFRENSLPLLIGSLYGLSAGYAAGAIVTLTGWPAVQFAPVGYELAAGAGIGYVASVCLTYVWLMRETKRRTHPLEDLRGDGGD